MTWKVSYTRKAEKQRGKLPEREKESLDFLVRDLHLFGPAQPLWPNYSKLGKDQYHCHLSYRWVACWRVREEKVELIEIYYAGSRENAPY